MVYVLRNAAFLVALFFSFHVEADIYQGVPFEAPKVESQPVGACYVIPSQSGGSAYTETDVSFDFCKSINESSCSSISSIYANDNRRITSTSLTVLSSDGDVTNWLCEINHETYKWTGSEYSWVAGTINFSPYPFWDFTKNVDAKSCPPHTKPSYEYPVDVDNDGEIDRCYDPSLLELNDSCPTHGTLFPSGSNTAQNMCMILPDGSQCHVSKRRDSYAIDEGSCYGNELPVFDDSGESQTDQDGCKTYSDALGNSSTSCPADPADHCSSGPVINGEARYQCEAGCGQDSTGAFVCFNQDNSGDNLPPFEPDPFTPDNPDTNNDGVSDTKDTNNMLQGVQNLLNDSKNATQEMSHNLGQKLDAIKANGDIIKTFGAGIGEINGGIGAINKKLEKEDKKTTYTTTAQTPDKTKMDELFSEQKLNQLKEDITDKKTEIQNEINQIRAEFSGLINIPVPSANGYQSRMLDLTMTSVDLSLSRLDYLWGLLAAPIMLVATFMAAMILLGRYF